jgi:hypothetical protein
MNAEIFYLEEQESLVPSLKELLRTHIHPGINVTLSKIKVPSREDDPSETGRRYVKLLQASIPPEKGLKLEVSRLVTFGYHFYIEVYYMLTYAAFGYRSRRAFDKHEFDCFFPAIAVRNRMVMIPEGLGKRLQRTWEALSPFNPLEMGGVLEVDFQDEGMLHEAVSQVGGRIRADFLRELRAYASYLSWGETSLPQIAQDLDVDLGFIQHSLKSELIEVAFYQKLTCQFDRHKLSLNRWNKVTLTIHNDSDIDLSELEVEISGPAKIRPTRIQTDVPAKSSAQVLVAVLPEDIGDFPLEIVFVLPDDKLFADWLPTHHIWLQVEG